PVSLCCRAFLASFYFVLDPSPTHSSTLSLHDALPIYAQRQPGVARADVFATLLRADTTRDLIARRWLHAIPRDMPVAVVVTLNEDRKSTRLNSSHLGISYAVFCLKKKKISKKTQS